MVGRPVDPEAGLPPDIQVANDLHAVLELELRGLRAVAGVAAAALGQRPGDLEAVAVADALVVGNRDARREVDVDGDRRHGYRTKCWARKRMPGPTGHPYRKGSQDRAGEKPENSGGCTLKRKSQCLGASSDRTGRSA